MAKKRVPAGSRDAAALKARRGAGGLVLGLLLALALTPGPRPAAATAAVGTGDLAATAVPYRQGATLAAAAATAAVGTGDLAATAVPYRQGATLAAAAAPYRQGAMRAAAAAPYRQGATLAAAVAPYRQGETRAAAVAPYRQGETRAAAVAPYRLGGMRATAVVRYRQGAMLAAAAALYQQGAMRAAAEVARRAGGAEGLVLAARATLVDALYLADLAMKPALLARAVGDAREALALAPDDAEPHLQLAMALGALADSEGPIAAHLNGHAKEGHELLLRARQLAPDDPWPDGLLGIWHLQIVRHGSAVLAAELYGASAETGLALCREAAARAPQALALRYGCAVSLLDVDPERFGREALRTLVAIVRMPAADAAERLVQRAARERIAAFRRQAAD